MDIEFKEKTYEKYFGHELARLTNITYSPDQCDEEWLGFDEAFYIPEVWFHRYGPHFRRSRRRRLSGVAIENFNRFGSMISERMPPFKFNLSVQFKRPTFLTTRRAKQWIDWGESYYRYATTHHQQEALERIDSQSYGRAATIYASPAFWQASELWNRVNNNDVVGGSNMANVGRLKNHGHYSYIRHGFQGKGHSETTEIESEPLRELIRRGLEQNEPLRLNQHLKKTATVIIEATSNADLVTAVFQRTQIAMGIEEIDPSSLYGALTIIEIFSDAFDTHLYAIG